MKAYYINRLIVVHESITSYGQSTIRFLQVWDRVLLSKQLKAAYLIAFSIVGLIDLIILLLDERLFSWIHYYDGRYQLREHCFLELRHK